MAIWKTKGIDTAPLNRPEPLNWDNNWKGTKKKGARALFGRKLPFHRNGCAYQLTGDRNVDAMNTVAWGVMTAGMAL